MLFAGTLGGPPEGYSPVNLKGQGAQVLWKGFSGAGHLLASCRGSWVGGGGSKITWKKASQTHRDNSSQCQSRPCGPASDSAPHVPSPESPQPWAPPAQILFVAVSLRPPGGAAFPARPRQHLELVQESPPGQGGGGDQAGVHRVARYLPSGATLGGEGIFWWAFGSRDSAGNESTGKGVGSGRRAAALALEGQGVRSLEWGHELCSDGGTWGQKVPWVVPP